MTTVRMGLVRFLPRPRWGVLVLALIGGCCLIAKVAGVPLLDFVPLGHGLAWASQKAAALRGLYAEHPLAALASFAALATVCAAVDLPAPGLVAAAGAAVFGVWPTVLLALPAAALGALVPFYLGRRLIGPAVERRVPRYASAMRQGIGQDGAFYLLSLRLMPMMPFAVVNVLTGLTPLSGPVFFAVTVVGRLPATILYCHAGRSLAALGGAGDLLSLPAALALAALAVCPLALRFGWSRLAGRRPQPALTAARDAADEPAAG